MRTLMALAIIVAFVAPDGFSTQESKPIPPGIRAADKQPGPADIPTLIKPRTNRPDRRLMKAQAQELSELAQTIPDAIAQINSGTLPKDMNTKLKRIEKLSKALRGEISN